MKKTHKIGGTNVLLTVLLFLGCLTVLFPLYMTVIIAFKSPTEMTNDIAGALSFPSTWNFSNFSEAMRVTNFWHSLGNSFLITAVTIVLAVLLHSMAGYAIGRNMARKKGYKLVAAGYRCRFGEIDLIAIDGKTLCFIEVKTRSNLAVGLPRDYVTAAKQERIRKTALFYLSEKELDCPVRFDVAEVYRSDSGALERIEYMKNAF